MKSRPFLDFIAYWLQAIGNLKYFNVCVCVHWRIYIYIYIYIMFQCLKSSEKESLKKMHYIKPMRKRQVRMRIEPEDGP